MRNLCKALGLVLGFGGCEHTSHKEAANKPAWVASAHTLAGGGEHWVREGFFEVSSPVLLCQDAKRNLDVQIWMKLPSTGEIDVIEPAGSAPSVTLPAGTIVDRVEYRQVAGRWVVADVRGTQFDGLHETFRAYRPMDQASDQVLFGKQWARESREESAAAVSFFKTAMADGHGFLVGDPGLDAESRAKSVARFSGILRCASCHQYDQASPAVGAPNRQLATRGGSVRASGQLWRSTDHNGLYSLRTALQNSAPLETYRPRDPNLGRKFVHYTCGESARTPSFEDGRAVCDGAGTPVVHVDMQTAFAQRDDHAIKVCKTRAQLASRMTQRAREVFATTLRDCGL